MVDIKRSFFKAAVKAKLFFRGQRNILWEIEVICYNIRKATQIVTRPNENRNHLPRFPAPLNSDNISIWPNKLSNKFSPTNSTQIWNEKKNHRIFFPKNFTIWRFSTWVCQHHIWSECLKLSYFASLQTYCRILTQNKQTKILSPKSYLIIIWHKNLT